jgi:hypothetical protein
LQVRGHIRTPGLTFRSCIAHSSPLTRNGTGGCGERRSLDSVRPFASSLERCRTGFEPSCLTTGIDPRNRWSSWTRQPARRAARLPSCSATARNPVAPPQYPDEHRLGVLAVHERQNLVL